MESYINHNQPIQKHLTISGIIPAQKLLQAFYTFFLFLYHICINLYTNDKLIASLSPFRTNFRSIIH